MSAQAEILDALVGRAFALERAKNGLVRRHRPTALRTVASIDSGVFSRLNRMGRLGTRTLSRRSLQDLRLWVHTRGRKEFNKVRDAVQEDIVELARRERQWVTNLLKHILEVRGKINISTASLREVRKGLRLPFSSGVGEAATYREWFAGLSVSALRRIERTTLRGITDGEDSVALARRIRRASRLVGPHTETLVRTYAHHAVTQTRAAIFRENRDLLRGEQWVSIIDGSTSTICIDLHGEIFVVGEGRHPPAHPNCRSDRIPLIKSWRDLGLPDEFEEVFVREDVVDANVITSLSRLSTQEQNKALGTSRAKLLREGKITDKRSMIDAVSHRFIPLTELSVS